MIGAGQQPDKQTNKPTDTETGKHLGRKTKKKYLQIDAEADLQQTNAHIEVNKK